MHVTKRLCGLPSFFNLPLCKRIYQNSNENIGETGGVDGSKARGIDEEIKIKIKQFLTYWNEEVEPFGSIERFYRIIKQRDAEYITRDDFFPFIQELLHFHPGLDFLDGQDEFQKKYALTVVTRIFYKVNKSRSGKISLNELKRSNLVEEFMHVDEEMDINKVFDYFSYEHFYVLYCRFFELDVDKDLKINREDMLKFGEHSLSDAIVDRIFQVGHRAFTDGHSLSLSYSLTVSLSIYFSLLFCFLFFIYSLLFIFHCSFYFSHSLSLPTFTYF